MIFTMVQCEMNESISSVALIVGRGEYCGSVAADLFAYHKHNTKCEHHTHNDEAHDY